MKHNGLNKNGLCLAILVGATGFLMAPAFAQDAKTADHMNKQQHEEGSDQPVNDTWITTKVKAELLADRDVSGMDISVETVNGTVTLTGHVDTQAQIDRATALARGIKGVTNVDASGLSVAGTHR